MFPVFIGRKLQLSTIVIILFLCPALNQLQSRGVSPCIVTHLQALFGTLPLTPAASSDQLVKYAEIQLRHAS